MISREDNREEFQCSLEAWDNETLHCYSLIRIQLTFFRTGDRITTRAGLCGHTDLQMFTILSSIQYVGLLTNLDLPENESCYLL